MPQKLETVLKHVEELSNDVHKQLIKDYHRYLLSRDTSTNYQKDNIKLIYMFAKFIGESKTLYDIKDQEIIVAFLDTRRKSKEDDPEQKWITTWNDYLWRLKMFYRWLNNVKPYSFGFNFKLKPLHSVTLENSVNASSCTRYN